MQFPSFRTLLNPATTKRDAEIERQIGKAVRSHCRVVGCNESNTIAAVAWALKSPGHTLAAIRSGNQRADQLRARQSVPQPEQRA